MIKHEHNEFPSDVFVILEAAGATVTIGQNYFTFVSTIFWYLLLILRVKY